MPRNRIYRTANFFRSEVSNFYDAALVGSGGYTLLRSEGLSLKILSVAALTIGFIGVGSPENNQFALSSRNRRNFFIALSAMSTPLPALSLTSLALSLVFEYQRRQASKD